MGKKVYIKFTNGSTTMLIDVNDEIKQNDAIESGFYMVTDEDGSPAVVTSEELMKGKSKSQAELINAVQEKLSKKSETNKRKIDQQKKKSEEEIIEGLV